MQRLKYVFFFFFFFFFFFLLNNPLICNLFTFFFLIFVGFCFLQDYDYEQISVVLASCHDTPAEASGHIDPTPIGFPTDDVPVSQQVALALDHVVATSFSHDKIVVHVHKSEMLYELFDDHFLELVF
jgi:hypothetical protein